MNFCRTVAGLSLKYEVRRTTTQWELRVEPLLLRIEKSKEVFQVCD